MNENIKKLGYFFIIIFSILGVYLGYLNSILGPKMAVDPHNRRLAAAEQAIARGTVYDKHGVVLAEDKEVNGIKRRNYPLGISGAHLVGYVSQQYGRTGVESVFDQYLLGIDQAGKIKSMLDKLFGRQQLGYDIVLSIDAKLQREAANLLKGRKGAVVALDPKSGKILAMVSLPSFDPNLIDTVVGNKQTMQNGNNINIPITGYDMLVEQSQSAPLLNRASRGIYPPGSVFKIITEAGALEANPVNIDRKYDCEGSLEIDGFILKDLARHGLVDLNKGMALSCNTYFASLGLELGEEKFKNTVKSFGFELIDYTDSGKQVGQYPVINGEVPFNPGTVPANTFSQAELASSAMGQGRVLVSPLQMALVASAVANGGVIKKPSILEYVVSKNGLVIKKGTAETLSTPITSQTAGILAQAMVETVRSGTGTTASISGIQVAGKTGSAQNPSGDTHAWFIGFAPADEPEIVVSVVVENAGGGSAVSAPIAREIIKQYLNFK